MKFLQFLPLRIIAHTFKTLKAAKVLFYDESQNECLFMFLLAGAFTLVPSHVAQASVSARALTTLMQFQYIRVLGFHVTHKAPLSLALEAAL